MENKLKKGTVLKLYEDSNEEYFVVDSIIKEDKKYAILSPYNVGDNNEVEVDVKDMLLICVNDDNPEEPFEYVTDTELAKEIVEQLLAN